MTKGVAKNFNCLARLSCDHAPVFPIPGPQLGEVVWCRKCSVYREVVELPSEFSWRCDRCRGSRQYGGAKLTAQRGADRHTRRFPGHVVTVYLGNVVLETRTPHGTQSELMLDTPPF